eukprot:PhM_4_TR7123/c0_g1_i1/m.90513
MLRRYLVRQSATHPISITSSSSSSSSRCLPRLTTTLTASYASGGSFQAFSSADEQELVTVLTSRPRHVLRKVRLMVQHSRQRLATFRNTVTYLMVVLQGRLQQQAIPPETATEVIASIMEECVRFDTPDLAHLLFRASLRFAKYGVTTPPRTLRLLLDAYKNSEDATNLMAQLGKEVRNQPGCRALAITAFLFAGNEAEAEAVRAECEAKGETLTEEDITGLIQGYVRLGRVEKVIPLLDDKPTKEHYQLAILSFRGAVDRTGLGANNTRGGAMDQIVQERYGWTPESLAALIKIAESAKAANDKADVKILPFDDAVTGVMARALLRDVTTLEEITAVEERLAEYGKQSTTAGTDSKPSAFGLNTMTAFVSAISRVRVDDEKKADDVMSDKVESLKQVLEYRLRLAADHAARIKAKGKEAVSAEEESEMASMAADTLGLDTVHVTTLIRGYAALNQVDMLKGFLVFLKSSGYTPDHGVYTELIRGFGTVGNIKEALLVKHQMEVDGVHHTTHVYAVLFKTLGKFYPTVVERYEKEMRQKNIRPDAHTLTQLIIVHGDIGNYAKVDELMLEVQRRAERGENMYTYALVSVALRVLGSHSYEKAAPFIRLANERGMLSDRFVRAAVCNVYTRYNKHNDLDDFLRANRGTYSTEVYNSLLAYYGRLEDRTKFNEVLHQMRKQDHVFDETTYTTLVSVYARWKHGDKIAETLQELKKTNIVVGSQFYNIVAQAYHSLGKHDEVDNAWNDLVNAKIPTSTKVFNGFLEIYIARNDLTKMRSVLQTMMARIPPNSVTMTTVLDMLGRLGRLEEMEQLLSEMQASKDAAPTSVTYHQVMSAYAKRGDVVKMVDTRRRMHEAGYADSHITYNILLVGYTKAKQFERVADTIREREAKGIPMDEVSYGVLIRTYGFSMLEQQLDDLVAEVFALQEKGKLKITIRMLGNCGAAYTTCKNKAKVHKYASMILAHPDAKTRDWVDALLMYSRVGDDENMELLLSRYHATMPNAPPNEEMYNIVVRGYAKMRLFERLQRVLIEMRKLKVRLDATTAMELSAVLMKAGKGELARQVLATQQTRLRQDELEKQSAWMGGGGGNESELKK